MDENRNPEEYLLDFGNKEQWDLHTELKNLQNRIRHKSGTWDSSNYDVVPEIESLSRQEQSEPSPLSSSTGHNIRNRRLATAGNSGGGGGAALLGVGGRSSGTPVPYNSHYHHHHHHHHHHQPQQDGRRSPRIWNEYRKDRDRRWSSGKMWENSQRRSWNHSHGGGGEATGEKVAAPGTQTKPEKIKVDDVSAWTLFKPPPAFPVDNSSAKIVPKISYASKVKGNLQHRQAGSGSMGGEEPQSLGAIFQNEWGLSFINEPSGSENTDPAQELNSKTDSDPVTQPAPHFGNGVTPEPPAIMDTDRLARLPTPSQEPEEPCTEQPPEMHYSLMEALRYHAQAWEQTCMRHKQDPKLVIWYEESLEQPA